MNADTPPSNSRQTPAHAPQDHQPLPHGGKTKSTIDQPGPGAEVTLPDELLDTLLTDQRQHWEIGERIPISDYLHQYPSLAVHPERAADLVYQEFILREELGEEPEFEEYLRDYPQCATALQNLFEADHWLQGPAIAASLPGPKGRFGDYELIEEVARGGMGVVYKARQLSLKRVVALKMLLAGQFASEADVQRFRNEAEAVAALQHPNIVAIHDVGVQNGQHYFAMDFVAGQSLAALIREQPLPASRAARYVQVVAAAMHHAHEHKILHRDLKPSNVLIDAADQPRITDFGLAKRVEGDRRLTATDQVLGTPSYMPPEQATGNQGQIGPASDVYALGAVLYELLTGRPPFLAATPLDTLLQVVGAEPAALYLLNPTVPRDLETICLKCLPKEPGKRYPTAKELADDLGRFLAREPIRARRVGRVERLVRWCKRRPAVAGLMAALLLVFLLGVGGIYGERRCTENQAVQARKERDTAQRESQRAEANFEDAQDAVESMLTRVGKDQLAHIPQMEELRHELLEEALKFNLKFLQGKGTDLAVRAAAGRAYWQVGFIQHKLGQNAQAEAVFRKSIDLFKKLADESPTRPDYRKGLASSYTSLATLLMMTDRLRQAEKVYDQVQPILERLAADSPDHPDSLTNLAVLHDNRTQLFLLDNDQKRADVSCRKALELTERLVRLDPDNATAVLQLASIQNKLGIIYNRTNRPGEARVAYHQAITTLQQLVANTPQDPDLKLKLATANRNSAIFLRNNGMREEAQKAFALACTQLEQLIADFPNTPAYRSELGEALQGMALTFTGPQARAEARRLLEQAVRHQQMALQLSPEHRVYRLKLCNEYHCLATVLLEMGNHSEASKAAISMAKAFDGRTIDFREGARLLAECVLLAQKDDSLSEDRRKVAAKTYANQAVDLLRYARAKGYFRAEHCRTHPDLNPLRSFPEFKKLISELEEKDQRKP